MMGKNFFKNLRLGIAVRFLKIAKRKSAPDLRKIREIRNMAIAKKKDAYSFKLFSENALQHGDKGLAESFQKISEEHSSNAAKIRNFAKEELEKNIKKRDGARKIAGLVRGRKA